MTRSPPRPAACRRPVGGPPRGRKGRDQRHRAAPAPNPPTNQGTAPASAPGMTASEERSSAATPRAERQARHAAVYRRRAPPGRHPHASPVTSASRGTHTSRPVTPPPPEGLQIPRPAYLARQPPAGPPGGPTARPSGGAWAEAKGHELEQYRDHTLHGLSKANKARLCARVREAEGRTSGSPPSTSQARNTEGHKPPGTPLVAPCTGTARGACATLTRQGGAYAAGAGAHTHTTDTRR